MRHAIGLINAALSGLILLLSEKREREGREEGGLFPEQFIQLLMRTSHLTGVPFLCKQPDSHNFDPCWENPDLSVPTPRWYLFAFWRSCKNQDTEPNLTNKIPRHNTVATLLSLVGIMRRQYNSDVTYQVCLSLYCWRWNSFSDETLSRLSSKYASTNQKYCPDLDSYENKNLSPVGAEVALTTGCTWGVHVQVDRVQNSGFVQSHKWR